MSEVYDNWERLVGAVIKREELRQIALCESLSSAISTEFSSHLSFDSSLEDAAVAVGNNATGTIAGGITTAVGNSAAVAIAGGSDVGNGATGAIAGEITTAFGNGATGAVAGGIPTAAGNNATGAIAGRFAAAAALLFSAPAVPLTRYRRRKPRDHFFDVHLGQLRRFSLLELRAATYNFSNKCILGGPGFCKVYKGRLADGSLVAVKRLKVERIQGGELQFQTEVEAISMAVHQNVLRLHGFCTMRTERLLVYPLMVNGSVASWLRGRPESKPPLDWPIRKRIALGSARGLAYLHDHCDPRVIHRDVKVVNILLDEDFEAVLGGFGLAKLMGDKDTHVTTAVHGTIGHLAPEYLSSGKCSEKADVFSYGVMLLELITGLGAFDLARLANDHHVMLLDWVNGLLKEKKLETLVDADLQGIYINEEVEQLTQVALLCTQISSMERPKMSEVVGMLEGDGLAERWEEWQKKEMFRQDFKHTHRPNTNWIIYDSIF